MIWTIAFFIHPYSHAFVHFYFDKKKWFRYIADKYISLRLNNNFNLIIPSMVITLCPLIVLIKSFTPDIGEID